ncbi:fructokinase [Treponema primitia ZAS-2]|uniref:Fructokinase n=1 Tax=Treponema primitia (strain ATCC BAA-887 / DSM 12427 / ZAS-2) TaxID=545694 RepID=F5YR22_TREPZ|nr:carbohydrate kinase [Treponema primitia]AEF86314.1 fructokinase [Treponema primitia ZAS-2]
MILSCGEAIIDMIPVKVPGRGDGFLPCPGGSPFNTAIAIGRLGVPVRFLSRLSRDFFGEILINRLIQSNVGIDLIPRTEQNSTLAFVKLDQGQEPRYVFYTEGAADCSFSLEDLPPVLAPEIRCVLFGSIALTMEPSASTIETFIARVGGNDVPDDKRPLVSLDPNVRPFMIRDREAYVRRFEAWVGAASIAKISEADFDFIYPGLGLEKSLQRVLDMGPRLALSTLGPKGALALLRRKDGRVLRVSAPVVDIPVVDTIGAGDTFHGAFLSWLELKGKMSHSALAALTEQELYDALFFANKAASLVCSRQGAEPPTLQEVEALKGQ